MRQSMDGPGGEHINFSVPEVKDFRDGAKSFSGIAEYSPWTLTLQENSEVTRVSVGLVTGNFFEVMGLSPELGRVTGPGDNGPGVPGVVVLTYEFWMKHYGGEPAIVGKVLKVHGHPATGIGVL